MEREALPRCVDIVLGICIHHSMHCPVATEALVNNIWFLFALSSRWFTRCWKYLRPVWVLQTFPPIWLARSCCPGDNRLQAHSCHWLQPTEWMFFAAEDGITWYYWINHLGFYFRAFNHIPEIYFKELLFGVVKLVLNFFTQTSEIEFFRK